MLSLFRAFGRHGGRRVGTSALTIGLVTSLASLTVIVSGPAPAGANHDPTEATAEIHITKIVYGAAFPGPAGNFTTGDSETAIPGFPASIPDGETVSFEVAPGTYDITEVVGVNDTPPHIFCSSRPDLEPDPMWSVSGAVLTLAPSAGSFIACVFTNNIPAVNANPAVPGEINIVKVVENDPGDGQTFSFGFNTGDNPDPEIPDLAHGDTVRLSTDAVQLTNPNTNLPTLGYTIGESEPDTPYQYVSLTCGGNFGSFVGAGNTNDSGNPGAGIPRPGNSQFITCIYVNRFAAGLELVKVLAGPPPPQGDLFGLDINGGEVDEFVPIQGGSTFPLPVNPGLVTFRETAGGTTELDEYLTQISCVDRDTQAPRQFTLDGDGRGGSLDLEAGDDVICTITNTWVELSIVKDGPAQAPVGSTVTYDFTLTNNGDNELTMSSAGDDKLGSLEDEIIAACGDTVLGEHVLAPDGDPGGGDVCQFSVDHVVTDLFDPLTNTVNVAYTNQAGPVLASDTHTLDVVFPFSTLAVVVVGGDPDFELTGPGLDEPITFTLEPDGEPFTALGLPAGQYTIDMTAIEDGFVLDAIDCGPEETSVNLAAGTVVFDVADGPVICTYTLSAEDDDDYDQYPGDDDFDFDTPFDDADDDDDDVQAPAVVAGDNQNNNNGGPGSADPGLSAAGDPGGPAPAADSAPQAVDQLPRTGTRLTQAGLMAGLLMILLGVAALLGARRREMHKA